MILIIAENIYKHIHIVYCIVLYCIQYCIKIILAKIGKKAKSAIKQKNFSVKQHLAKTCTHFGAESQLIMHELKSTVNNKSLWFT